VKPVPSNIWCALTLALFASTATSAARAADVETLMVPRLGKLGPPVGGDVGRPRQLDQTSRTRRRSAAAALGLAMCFTGVGGVPHAVAVPGPEVEYVYNVVVRRHFNFPNNDALGYGFGICDKVTRGVRYADVMTDVKRDVFPSDEGAANYVVSYAVGILCPAQLWQLRNSAAGYRPPF
jgi:hypothetical protein